LQAGAPLGGKLPHSRSSSAPESRWKSVVVAACVLAVLSVAAPVVPVPAVVAHVPAVPAFVGALLLLTFLLFPLLLLLLLIGLSKHHLRRNRDQGKAKQKHCCLSGVSKCGCNYRGKNGLMRQTFRHSCRLDSAAFEKVLGRLCGKIADAIRCITI
jgi:hypothetical protein